MGFSLNIPKDTNLAATAAPSSTPYLDSIKASSPELYKKIVEWATPSANEAFNGQIQDYQAQLFTPLSKQYSKSDLNLKDYALTPVETGYWNGDDYISQTYLRPNKNTLPTPEGVNFQYDNNGNVSGFTKKIKANGIDVTGSYDANGNATGFTSGLDRTTWLDGSHYVTGQWDASGKPTPAQHATKSGGWLSNTFGDAFGGLSDLLNSVGSGVNGAVQSALDDPAGTLIKAAAIASAQPELMALANAGVAVAHGASLEDAALAAGKGYAAGAIGSEISSNLSPELTSNGLSATDAATVSKIAGQAGGAAATGNDPLKALVAGGIGAGTLAIASDIPGFDDMNKYQQGAVTKAISNTLQGKDPTQGLINEAIASGIDAIKNSASSSELIDQTMPKASEPVIDDTANPDVKQGPAPASDNLSLDDLLKQTAPKVTEPVAEPTPNPVVTNNPQAAEDYIPPAEPAPETAPKTEAQKGYYDEITGKFVPSEYGSPELDNTSGTGTMDGWQYDSKTQKWTDPSGTTTDLSYLSNKQTPMDTSTKTTPSDASRFLLDQGTLSNLLKYGGAAAGIGALINNGSGAPAQAAAPAPTQTVNWNPQAGTMQDGVAYGLAQLNPTFTQHAAQGGIMSLGGYASGGNPRLLKGPGDGMSDNIPATIAGKQPARLADGEFVIPADVVSHLGNGSTEAGANVLHQMMERVRKARTGNPHQGRQINPKKYLPGKGK